MATFALAPKEVTDIVSRLIDKHHGDLSEAEVRIDVLMAFAPRDKNGQPTGPAVKWSGHPAAAKVRVVPLKDRVKGHGDAEVILDGDTWKDRPAKEQEAILGHELMHLEVKRDEEGAIQADDIGRPKLKLRPADWLLEGFESIARRYGDSALEVKAARQLAAGERGQMLFDWARG